MMSTKVGPGGRVLIPVELRRVLDLAEGTPLIARVEEDRLILERRDAILERATARFASVPQGVSLTDELLVDRRREVERGHHRARSRARWTRQRSLPCFQREAGAELHRVRSYGGSTQRPGQSPVHHGSQPGSLDALRPFLESGLLEVRR